MGQFFDQVRHLIADEDHNGNKKDDPQGVPPVLPDYQEQKNKVYRQPVNGIRGMKDNVIQPGGMHPIQKKESGFIDMIQKSDQGFSY